MAVPPVSASDALRLRNCNGNGELVVNDARFALPLTPPGLTPNDDEVVAGRVGDDDEGWNDRCDDVRNDPVDHDDDSGGDVPLDIRDDDTNDTPSCDTDTASVSMFVIDDEEDGDGIVAI